MRFLPGHHAILALFFLGMAPLDAADQWEKLENCRLVEDIDNDAGSFHIVSSTKEIVVRLYFVDCLESDSSAPRRALEQAGYFGKSSEEVIHVGKYARQSALRLLSRPFSVFTKYEEAGSEGGEPSYFAFVTTPDGKDLGEILVEDGFARSRGKSANFPGKSETSLKSRYDILEARAKHTKSGIYSVAPLMEVASVEMEKLPPGAKPARTGLFDGFESDLGISRGSASAMPAATPEKGAAVPSTPPPTEPADDTDENPKNFKKRWTPEEEDALRVEVKAGKSLDSIAAIHGRTPSAVAARIKKLGLSTVK